jgi:wyosine [tRNA(Phe)-imidazoG37] synthetase (radical SAM superfamily)
VLPSLDAGTPKLYKTINRPHPDVSFDSYIEGLISFSQEFEGGFWLEVMLIQGINDTEEALADIARRVEEIKPDRVDIGLPTRPPAEVWVKPAEKEGIIRAIAILGEVAVVAPPIDGKFDLSGSHNVADAIIAIITRHPMSDAQLISTLSVYSMEERVSILDQLEASEMAQKVERYGQIFWCTKSSYFPEG